MLVVGEAVSRRTMNLLSFRGVRTLDDILTLSRDDVAAIRGMGQKRLREVEKALRRRGQRLKRGTATLDPHVPSNAEEEAAIGTLGLSPRTVAKLHGAGIVTVGDLVRQRPCDLQRLPHLGRRMYEEINYILAKHGLALAEYVHTNRPPPPVKDDPETTIESLGEHGLLSPRTVNLLRVAGARTAGELVTKSAIQLVAIKGFGKMCLAEVRAAVAWMEMTLRGDEPPSP